MMLYTTLALFPYVGSSASVAATCTTIVPVGRQTLVSCHDDAQPAPQEDVTSHTCERAEEGGAEAGGSNRRAESC